MKRTIGNIGTTKVNAQTTTMKNYEAEDVLHKINKIFIDTLFAVCKAAIFRISNYFIFLT